MPIATARFHSTPNDGAADFWRSGRPRLRSPRLFPKLISMKSAVNIVAVTCLRGNSAGFSAPLDFFCGAHLDLDSLCPI